MIAVLERLRAEWPAVLAPAPPSAERGAHRLSVELHRLRQALGPHGVRIRGKRELTLLTRRA